MNFTYRGGDTHFLERNTYTPPPYRVNKTFYLTPRLTKPHTNKKEKVKSGRPDLTFSRSANHYSRN